jgi:hypothetical protein
MQGAQKLGEGQGLGRAEEKKTIFPSSSQPCTLSYFATPQMDF